MRHDDRTPQEFREEVDRKRRELDSTIVAIERRLSPQRLADSGIAYLRHSGAREFAANLGTSVKENPLAVVLVGAGLGWLMASRDHPSASRGAAQGRTASPLERASDAVAAARARISRTSEAARERIDDARETAAHIQESARRQMERARGGYNHMMREQPLILGCVGLALGVIAAAAVAGTHEEDPLMSNARDRLAEMAARTGAEQDEKAERTTSPTANARSAVS